MGPDHRRAREKAMLKLAGVADRAPCRPFNLRPFPESRCSNR